MLIFEEARSDLAWSMKGHDKYLVIMSIHLYGIGNNLKKAPGRRMRLIGGGEEKRQER